MSVRALLIIAWLVGGCRTAAADDEILVAVASNFLPVARVLAEDYEAATGTHVKLSAGSSGKLYAQIINGAPFDLFLSADEARPMKLVERGDAVAASRFTYAVGRLLLWSGDTRLVGSDCLAALRQASGRVAVANPDTAPYGRAAIEFFKSSAIDVASRRVTGENIAQALQFAVRGGAQFGVLAKAQADKLPAGGCRYTVPADQHTPIRQQAVLLRRAADNALALHFLEFLASDARERIAAAGYEFDDE
ncbi:MAG: molybdate ABC transporter substrate-binding protein [Pseudomonadota bacterium]